MRIAVIGGNGQTGNYLLPMLVQEGHEVISICRGNRGYFRQEKEFDQVREVHLTRGAPGFEREVAALGCDVVVDTICFTREEARHCRCPRRYCCSLRGNRQHLDSWPRDVRAPF